MNKQLIKKSSVALAIASTFMANGTLAEETQNESKQIEVIEVRGGQRVQSLNEVPASVSVIGGESLKQMKINKLDDLSQSLPNVSISQNAIQDTVSIRGVNSDLQAGGEQSVGIFLDGIYHGRGIQSRFSFMDVDAIEVLRGPQGSLFGKNTVGGVISILPAQPKDYFEANITAGYEFEFGKKNLSGYVTGALNESGSLTGRLSFQGSESNEGWVKNLATGDTGPITEDEAFRGILNWEVNNDLKLNFRAEQGSFTTDGAAYEIIYLEDDYPLTALAKMVGAEDTINGETLVSNGNYPGIGYKGEDKLYYMDANFEEYALKAEYSLAKGTLTAIAAHSSYDFVRTQDSDFGPLPVIQFTETEEYDQNSLEVRFVSEDNDDFEYIVGGYWQNSKLPTDAVLDIATAPGTPVSGLFPIPTEHALTSRLNGLNQDTDTLAVFAQLSFGLTENIKLNLAGRYSDEKKTATQYVEIYGGTGDGAKSGLPLTNPVEVYIWSQALMEATPHVTELTREESLFSPSASLTWQASDNSNYYFSVSKGFKGGGFNAIAMSANKDEIEYENEEAISTEIGAKFELLDGEMILNTAIFNVTYDNMQTTLFTGGTTFVVDNAAKATSQGVEVEMRWLLSDSLTLDVAAGYIDFSFDDYKNAGCTARQLLDTGLNGTDCANAGINDLTGRTNQDVPELTMSLSLQHEMMLGEYTLVSRADMNYVDEYFATADLDPITVQEAYNLVNASITLISPESDWQLNFVAKNLTNEEYFSYANDVPLFTGSQFVAFNQPTTFSVEFSYTFE
jgi:outer membrane receptor protein involved in Fe transport